jgi:hypothetical protein
MASEDNSDIGIIQPCQNGAPSKVKLMIHHQFPGIELVSPLYCSNGAACCLLPDQRVNDGSMVQVGFNIDLSQRESIGVVMYRMERKNADEFDEATCTQLVIIWMVDRSEKFSIVSHLLMHDKNCVWNSDKLMELAKHCRLSNVQHGPIEETWLLHDNTVLMTRVNTTFEEEYYKLEMTISETDIKDDTQRPQYIGLDR